MYAITAMSPPSSSSLTLVGFFSLLVFLGSFSMLFPLILKQATRLTVHSSLGSADGIRKVMIPQEGNDQILGGG